LTEETKILEKFEEAFWATASSPSPKISLSSFTGASSSFASLALARDKKYEGVPFVLVVTPGLPEADILYSDIQELSPYAGVRVLEFPPLLDGEALATSARLKAAAALDAYSIRPYPLVMVASYPSLLGEVPHAAAVAALTFRLDVSSPLVEGGFSGLAENLRKAGYERMPEVVSVGQYSVRGGVLDLWPPDEESPVRAEFFGDELESLRRFNPGTQVSFESINTLDVSPITIPSASQGASASEHIGLLDAIPPASTVLWIDHNDYKTEDFISLLEKRNCRQYFSGDPPPRGVPSVPFQTSVIPGFAELGPEAARQPELLDAARLRLSQHIATAKKTSLIFETDKLSGGFEVSGLLVVTKSDRVFAHRRRVKVSKKQFVAGERFTDTLDVEPGELVVHLDYGIGRFQGSTEVEAGSQRYEVFTIEYADGGKLHVPVTHAHLLSRYVGVKGEEVSLHRLDGKRWGKEKEGTERAVRDLAAALLETQAKRAIVPGFAFDVTLPDIALFDEAFPYEETLDQKTAIEDVKRDMAATKPMDRLICGDAGYGKTEVAMRAAFIAAMNGKQVALLAPTTVLAEQHYESFLARFDGTPIRIESMSRFQSDKAKRLTRERLLSGATDILIGTHAILSKSVVFKDLGLVIIDEEQRFGVKHKEHLKHLRATADILTMSATPIPRTLYLSMTGARDLSLLRTPPSERVAVETSVARDADVTIRDAIRRELARGGQVYYLYNRVSTIELAYKRLKELVPEANIEVAHGQMATLMLADKMRRFSRGETNVLLCTTIVESGLDIPRANTIIVDRADRFGMAELYQLRGRVGRSSRQGYALFLLPAEGSIDSEARERLDALKKHSGLGAGFNLSLRDLELRGAGNLLGKEQSGHIAAVGFQLYCQLLQRTMARLKGEKVNDVVDVSVSLDFLDYSPGSVDADEYGACLPYSYVDEESQRIDFHKRLAAASTISEIRLLKKELADRYGKLPAAATRLIRLAEFRINCASHGITQVISSKGRTTFRKGQTLVLTVFSKDTNPDAHLRLLNTRLADI
jgi:transcription-repair coupling factor (superfamily II helicase)